MDKQLVDFGNFLLKKVGAKVDGVTHADLANWKHEAGLPDGAVLPSKLQQGDAVNIDFGVAGKITGGKILRVLFSPGKTRYDIELKVDDGPVTRIHNVDGIFVNAAE